MELFEISITALVNGLVVPVELQDGPNRPFVRDGLISARLCDKEGYRWYTNLFLLLYIFQVCWLP